MPKISELPPSSFPPGSAVLPLVTGGVTSQATLSELPISTLTQAQLDILNSNKAAVTSAVNTSFTAVNNGSYAVTASLTVTDPASPVNGNGYSVYISAGTATIGGVPYSVAGLTIQRKYNTGAWISNVISPAFDSMGVLLDANLPSTVATRFATAKGDAGFGRYNLPDRIQVTNHCVAYGSALSTTTTEAEGMYKCFHRICAAGATDISFVYGNISNANSNITDSTTNLVTLTLKCSIEYNSVVYPLFFNGRREITLEPGAIVETDRLAIKLPPSTAPSTTTIFSRQLVKVISGVGGFPRGTVSLASRGEWNQVGATGTVTDRVDSGSVTGVSNVGMFSPIAILGRPINRDYGSVAVFMDSLAQGVGATLNAEDRSWCDKAFSGRYGICNLAISGGTIAGWMSQGDARFRRSVLARINPSIVFAGSGGNDLNNPGVTALTLQGLIKDFWTDAKYLNCKVIGWTIPPRTSSTDSWTTLANQTLGATINNTIWEQERLAFNTWMRSGAEGYITDYVDFAAIVEEGGTVPLTPFGKWKVSGGAITNDGNHPNEAGHVLISAAVNTTQATTLKAS